MTPSTDERMERMRRAMRERHADVRPGPEFAARVVARLDSERAADLGWIALRMMPAAVLLVAVLATWVAITMPSSTAPELSTDDDLIVWLLDADGAP